MEKWEKQYNLKWGIWISGFNIFWVHIFQNFLPHPKTGLKIKKQYIKYEFLYVLINYMKIKAKIIFHKTFSPVPLLDLRSCMVDSKFGLLQVVFECKPYNVDYSSEQLEIEIKVT